MMDINDILPDGSILPSGEYSEAVNGKLGSLLEIIARGKDEHDEARKPYPSCSFEGPLYHGTDIAGIDRLHLSAYDDSMGFGVYLAADKATAEKFAASTYSMHKLCGKKTDNPIVYEVKARRKLTLLDLTRDDLFADVIADFRMHVNRYGHKTVDNADKSIADRAMWEGKILDSRGRFVFSAFSKDFTEFLYTRGYDGIMHGGAGSEYLPFDEGIGAYTQIVVFNPRDIEIVGNYAVAISPDDEGQA